MRRAMVRFVWRRILEAANRGDWEAAFAVLPPDYETYPPPEVIGLGFEPMYRGPDERLRLQLGWMDQLGEFQQEAKEVIDLGDRIVLLGWMRGTGLGSGAEFESEIAYVIDIEDGRLSREHFFRFHAEGLEAAELSDQPD
jgi:ketosteroid isomerase-like protein